MIGMHLTRTRGGISTLVSDLLGSSLSDEFRITYLASQADELGKAGKLVLAMSSAFRAAWYCLWRRPDLVYIHVGSNASLYREGLMILLAKAFRRKVVTHFHAGDVDLYYRKQPRLGRMLIRAALDVSDRMIAVSAESAAKIRAISACEHVVVIPNGIDPSRFLRKSEAGGVPLKILFVGAAGKLKGERDLLHALSILRRLGVPVRASLIGFGAERLRHDCAALGIQDMIDHLGPVPAAEMPERYSAADVFVLPTYAEAMPMSVLEAMASSLPVITTPVGGIPEILAGSECGHLVPAGDVSALAGKIAELAGDAEHRRRLGENARRRVTEHFTFRQCVTALTGHLLDVSSRTVEPVEATLMAKRSIKSAVSTIRKPRAAGGVHILAYHRVVGDLAKAEKEAYYGLSVSAETFRRHCEILRANYEVVSLETAAAALASADVGRPLAVLTFDDGYLDFYETAFPTLRELGLPATMFLPTSFIGTGLPLAHDRIFWLLKTASERGMTLVEPLLRAGVEASVAAKFARPGPSLNLTERLVYLPFRLRETAINEIERTLEFSGKYPGEYQILDWHKVREMAEAGITFGAHTANHVVLPLEDIETVGREVNESKSRLESELGVPIETFAYPNGEFTDAVRSAVESAGFSVAVTTKPMRNRRGADPLALGRTSLCEESTRGFLGRYSARVAAFRLGV
jgi:glycosyltransferase involved in cell wall biosynthesis/peptidoglycan/xylan/chitin deacetylase (PgdA/CDA1 family)